MVSLSLSPSKSLHSYNPIPGGCVLYQPLWNPGCWGPTFKSIDSYGQVCTRIGGVMSGDGDTMDGIDDYIKTPSFFGDADFKATAFATWGWFYLRATGLTHEIWGIKPATTTKFGVKFVIASSNVVIITFIREDNGATGRVTFADTGKTLAAATWYNYLITYDGNGTPDAATLKLYLNGADYAIPVYGTGYSGQSWKTDDNMMYTGRYSDLGTPIDGTIRENAVYNRTMSVGEAVHIYNETRGR